MIRTEAELIRQYEDKSALWIHDGNPQHPHALLSSGKHSNGFFNSGIVIENDQLLREAASDIVDLYLQIGGSLENIDRVVGPKKGATKMARFISIRIGQCRGRPCAWASPAKVSEGENKRMIFDDPENMVQPDETVLLCEDVLTTGGSVEAAITVSQEAGGIILPYVAVLVNRSGLTEVSGKWIFGLIDRPMPQWTPEECPLCPRSEAIRPKDNWARLTQPTSTNRGNLA